MRELSAMRRFYAEEIEAVANLSTPALVEALATVPRERFLGKGPWIVRADADMAGVPRQTPDDDPGRVYHNWSVAIDASRQLFNGAPGVIASSIDRLQLRPGSRVLHVGTGTGYYTAVLARVVGASGRVIGIEVDDSLALAAARNVADTPWVDIRASDGRGPFDEQFDGVLVNAGATHPESGWLDALTIGGRMILPLTATIPGMGNIGKGLQILLHKRRDADFDATTLTFVMIYSAVGLREIDLDRRLGEAMRRTPFPRLTRLRRDPHDQSSTCWLHATGWCLGT
jgi:protein-L-isoaspartate(D-aspartate) O-methyltransferase